MERPTVDVPLDRMSPAKETAARLEELVSQSRMQLSIAASAGRVAMKDQLMFETAAELQKWVNTGIVDFLEIFAGYGQLTVEVRKLGLVAGEGIDKRMHSYGRPWPLEQPNASNALAWLIAEGLRPRCVHTGTPCTHLCVIGNREGKEDTAELIKMAIFIAKRQETYGLLFTNENPCGSSLHGRPEWVKALGEARKPKGRWRYAQTTGCQLGLACPAERTSGSNTNGMKVLGRPIQKHQLWMSSFDLSPMIRECRPAFALKPATHEHQHARGTMKMPDGKWVPIAEYTGRYTAVLGAVSARCLRIGLESVRVADATDRSKKT